MLLRFLISLVIIAFSLVLKAEEVKSKLYLNEDYESCVKSSDKDSCYQIYLSGLCYLKLRKYTKARNIFREVIKRYPHSKYAVISMKFQAPFSGPGIEKARRRQFATSAHSINRCANTIRLAL